MPRLVAACRILTVCMLDTLSLYSQYTVMGRRTRRASSPTPARSAPAPAPAPTSRPVTRFEAYSFGNSSSLYSLGQCKAGRLLLPHLACQHVQPPLLHQHTWSTKKLVFVFNLPIYRLLPLLLLPLLLQLVSQACSLRWQQLLAALQL